MPGATGRGYVVDVQAQLLDHLKTRTVVPLLPQSLAPPLITHLNPVFSIGGEAHVMVTQAIATLHVRELREKVLSLDAQHDEITRALDILFTGY
jgi:toxin CcdB